MAIPAKPTLTTPPTAPVRGEDRASFATKANAYVVFIGTNVTDLTAAIDWQNTVFTATETEATDAAQSAVDAAAKVVLAEDQVALAADQVALAADEVALADAAAAAAVATANAEAWVSGASYDINDNAISQINFKTYRAKSTFTGQTTDPSADETRWVDVIPEPTAILQPSNVSPVDNATDIGSGPVLTGSPYYSLYGLPMAAGQWQVSTVADFATTVIDTGDVAGTAISFTATGLLVSTTYYWRLRYKDSGGVYSQYSDATEFATASAFFPSNEVAKLAASDAAVDDGFGTSSAIDGNYLVVGARYESSGAGAAYVYFRDGDGTWTQQAKIVASDAETGDYFGASVSISGDYIVVGANREDAGGTYAGAAYVFLRSGTSWTQQAKIVASDAETADYFGASVSISGDYIVVGAFSEDTGGSGAGAAYVFLRSGTSWTQQAKIVASDAETGDYFGGSVSISGDYIVVGANREDAGGAYAGAAYVFLRSGTSWTQQAKIVASDAETADFFGGSVSISGDYIVVGASNEDTGGSEAGAAYLFERSGTSWAQLIKYQSSDIAAGDRFGFSVAIAGARLLIGAPLKSTSTGAAYVFE
jgi:phosphopantetheinyl transferase